MAVLLWEAALWEREAEKLHLAVVACLLEREATALLGERESLF